MRRTVKVSWVLGAVGVLAMAGSAARGADDADQYVGAEKCKNCHAAPSKGDLYGVWTKSKHAKAYAMLASEEAKKIAKDKGIADPQQDKACAQCHVTAFDAPTAMKGKKFDPTQGVQCESCHGPSGKHVKARLDAEETPEDKVVELPKGERGGPPSAEVCIKCHNEKSPNYKPFDYKKFIKEIAHLDPRRKHPADYLDKLGESGGKPEEKK
ncbi:MAG: cytochrome c family protein [Planctomycetota bacterium]|nr:cytochrome c family protein [Planctomycetota bacterium]